MRAIIIAAGIGGRLFPITNNKPKCMLEVAGKTILETQLEALRYHGINDIVVVRGYQKEKINYPDLRYCENKDYLNNNILESLFSAEHEMNDDFIASYSDILYDKEIVRKLLENKSGIDLIVDVDWKRRYEGRTLHPITEAELVMVKNNRITKIGKGLDPCKAHGEFIGLGIFSGNAVETLKSVYSEVKVAFKDKPFHNAANIQKAYLTDMIQELIDRNYLVKNIDINGEWFEIDTPQDLERARKEWKTG